jgi:hypothetical protein
MADVVTADHLRRLRSRGVAFYRSVAAAHRAVHGASLAEVSS